MIFSIVVFALAVTSCLAQGTSSAQQQPILGGASGVYGDAPNTHFFCHDPNDGVYHYTSVNGFGYGNLTQAADGTWTGRGVWVECGFIGGEILTIDNSSLVSNWWYNQEGDANEFLAQQQPMGTSQEPAGTQDANQQAPTLFASARSETPVEILKRSDAGLPTLEQCWWLNSDVDVTTMNLGGKWTSEIEDLNVCLIGNAFARMSYNDSGNATGSAAGYSMGGVADWVVFSGHFVELLQQEGCVQGCDLYKVGGDGDILYEKYWCNANAAATTEIIQNVFERSMDQGENTVGGVPLCLIAAIPAFGYRVDPLSNATFV